MTNVKYIALGAALFMCLSGAGYAADPATPAAAPAAKPMMHHQHHHMMGCSMRLPPAKEKMMHDTMRRAMEQDKPLFGQMRTLHEKMHALMTADTFDKKAFLSAQSDMTDLHMKMERHRAEAMADVAEQLTPAERKSFCMGFGGPHGPGGPGFHHGFDHHGGRHGAWQHGWDHNDGMKNHNQGDYSNLNN